MFSLTYFESKKASKALPNPIITSIRESSFVVFSKWLRLGFHLVGVYTHCCYILNVDVHFRNELNKSSA